MDENHHRDFRGSWAKLRRQATGRKVAPGRAVAGHFSCRSESRARIKRFFLTLNERLRWLLHFHALEELAGAPGEFPSPPTTTGSSKDFTCNPWARLTKPCLPSRLPHEHNSRNYPGNRARSTV